MCPKYSAVEQSDLIPQRRRIQEAESPQQQERLSYINFDVESIAER